MVVKFLDHINRTTATATRTAKKAKEKKAIGLYLQNRTIRTCVTPFYTFPSRRRMTAIWTSSFSTGAQNKNFLFLFLNIDMVLSDSTPENFAKINIWQIKRNWITSLKFETVRTEGAHTNGAAVMMFEWRGNVWWYGKCSYYHNNTMNSYI